MKKTALVVDDSSMDRGIFVSALTRKLDVEAIEAADGEQCLNVIEERHVDLVLMDIMMPGLLGTHVLEKIREDFNPVELPIIMVTSNSEVTAVVDCLKKGANDYITKPVNFDVAVSRISTHLKLGEISAEISRLKESVAVNAMVVTYNHEINNPLAHAICLLEKLEPKNIEALEELRGSLWKVAKIVKSIKAAAEKENVDYTEYAGDKMMVKI